METVVKMIGQAQGFLRMGFQATISYPLSLVIGQFGTAMAILTYFFLDRIINSTAIVGYQYLTFVAIGLVGQMVVAASFGGIGRELDYAIQQGRLEMLLIEPIRWPLIPFGLALWPSVMGIVQALVAASVALLVGADIRVRGLVEASALLAMGVVVGAVLGTAAASIRVLAKRSDPLWLVYNIAVGLVGGIAVPINVLPSPLRALAWIFPTTYVTAGIRKALMIHPSQIYGPTAPVALLVLGFVVVLGGLIAVALFSRSLEVGRRHGILAGY